MTDALPFDNNHPAAVSSGSRRRGRFWERLTKTSRVLRRSGSVRDNELSNARLSDDLLRDCICRALGLNDDLRIIRRSPVRSYHQQLEIVTFCQPDTEGDTCQMVFVRVYRGQLCWCDVSRCDVAQRESAAWQIAERAGLPLVETYWHGWSEDTAVAVQQHVPDRTVWQLRNPSLLRESAVLLARLHQAEVNEKECVHLADMRLSPLIDRLTDCAAESQDALSLSCMRSIRARSVDIEECPAVFLHGDFHPSNLLTDGQRLTAVIDWEDAARGDPRIELATMDMYLRRFNGVGSWLRSRETKQLAELFLDSYQTTTGRETGCLEFWKHLLDGATVVLGKWLKHRVDTGLPFPPTKPGVWYRNGRDAERRVRRWANSS